MKIIKQEIEGTAKAPASKSLMQRAIVAALLADGKTKISNPSLCDDALTAINIAKALGAEIKEAGAIEINSKGIEENIHSQTLDCNESGFCMRMFSAITALFKEEVELTCRESLLSRPIGFIEEPLKLLGVKCETNKGHPPIQIQGPLKGGKVRVDGSTSSQFLSGLLMALPLCEKDSEIESQGLKSKAYVRMTLKVLEDFGIKIDCKEDLERFQIKGNQKYNACEYKIEGDWSSAAFMLVAGAIAGKMEVTGIEMNSLQADKEIVQVLREVGANVKIGNGKVLVKRNELNGFEFNVSECPDLFPVVSVLACNCKGKSIIKGIERLKHKESNRAEAMREELKKLGAKIELFEDRIEIDCRELQGGAVDLHKDHRIAMALAIAGMNSEKGVEIRNHECVSKSYPEFFEELKKLGVVLNE